MAAAIPPKYIIEPEYMVEPKLYLMGYITDTQKGMLISILNIPFYIAHIHRGKILSISYANV